MAATGTLTIGGTISGLPSGSKTFSASIALTNAVDESLAVILTSGDNTINIPTGATLVLMVPPTGNTTALRFASVTGSKLHLTNPQMWSFDSTVTSFIINAASLMTSATIFNFA